MVFIIATKFQIVSRFMTFLQQLFYNQFNNCHNFVNRTNVVIYLNKYSKQVWRIYEINYYLNLDVWK